MTLRYTTRIERKKKNGAFFSRRFWVKEPSRHSENTFAKKRYTSIVECVLGAYNNGLLLPFRLRARVAQKKTQHQKFVFFFFMATKKQEGGGVTRTRVGPEPTAKSKVRKVIFVCPLCRMENGKKKITGDCSWARPTLACRIESEGDPTPTRQTSKPPPTRRDPTRPEKPPTPHLTQPNSTRMVLENLPTRPVPSDPRVMTREGGPGKKTAIMEGGEEGGGTHASLACIFVAEKPLCNTTHA